MAITQAMCTSFKKELLEAKHKFTTSGGHTFKIALFTNSANLDATTTDYSNSGEVSPTNTNYTAGGQALAISASMPGSFSGGTAIADFADEVFSNVTLTARGAMIYNSTTGGGSNTTDAVAVLNFGSDKSATSGDFTVVFPAPTAANAIIRLATPS